MERREDDLGEPYMHYTAEIMYDYLSQKPILDTVTFDMRSTVTYQYYGQPPYYEGDVIFTLLCDTGNGSHMEVFEEYGLLYDEFVIDGDVYAAVRGKSLTQLTLNIPRYQAGPSIEYTTTTTKNPAVYYGIYKIDDLVSVIKIAIRDFRDTYENRIYKQILDFSNSDMSIYEEHFYGSWYREGETIDLTYQEDIFTYFPYRECDGFAEDSDAWYMMTYTPLNAELEMSSFHELWAVPKSNPDRLYRFNYDYINEPTLIGLSEHTAMYSRKDTDAQPVVTTGKVSGTGLLKLRTTQDMEWVYEMYTFEPLFSSGKPYEKTFTDSDGRKWVRTNLLDEEFNNLGWGEFRLLEYTDNSFKIVVQFVAEEWYSYINGAIDTFPYEDNAKHFVFTCTWDKDKAEWTETFEPWEDETTHPEFDLGSFSQQRMDIYEEHFYGTWSDGDSTAYFTYQQDEFTDDPNTSCVGFSENDSGAFMRSYNIEDDRSDIWFIPRSEPDTMYLYRNVEGSEIRNNFTGRYTKTASSPAVITTGKLSETAIMKLKASTESGWIQQLKITDIFDEAGYFANTELTYGGRKWLRKPYKDENGINYGMGDIYLLNFSEERFAIAVRYVSEDWYNYTYGDANDYTYDDHCKFFVCVSTLKNGKWETTYNPWDRRLEQLQDGIPTELSRQALSDYGSDSSKINVVYLNDGDKKFAVRRILTKATEDECFSDSTLAPAEVYIYNRSADEYIRADFGDSYSTAPAAIIHENMLYIYGCSLPDEDMPFLWRWDGNNKPEKSHIFDNRYIAMTELKEYGVWLFTTHMLNADTSMLCVIDPRTMKVVDSAKNEYTGGEEKLGFTSVDGVQIVNGKIYSPDGTVSEYARPENIPPIYAVTSMYSPVWEHEEGDDPGSYAGALYHEGSCYWHTGLWEVSQQSDADSSDLKYNLNEVEISGISSYSQFYALLDKAEYLGITDINGDIYKLSDRAVIVEYKDNDYKDDRSHSIFRFYLQNENDTTVYSPACYAVSELISPQEYILYCEGKHYFTDKYEYYSDEEFYSDYSAEEFAKAIGRTGITSSPKLYEYISTLENVGSTPSYGTIYRVDDNTVITDISSSSDIRKTRLWKAD